MNEPTSILKHMIHTYFSLQKADLAAKFFQKKHEEDRELESKFDEQQAQALQELAELNAQIEAAGAKEGEGVC